MRAARWRQVLGVMMVSGLAIGCGSDPSGPGGGGGGNNNGGGENTVAMVNGDNFSPSSLSVPVGTTVTWVNNAGVPHNTTSNTIPTGATSWASPDLSSGQSFQHTFNIAGTYNYECTLHSNMNGTITVTE